MQKSFLLAAAAAVAPAFTAGCGSADTTTSTSPKATFSTRAEHACPGSHVADTETAGCPAPSQVRQGRACDVRVTCPSPNDLNGACTCVDGAWSCAKPEAPAGYDPYPDCPDEGVDSGGACFQEGSSCLPSAATACYTTGVDLCTCSGHTWTCP